jgi:hypothetical protein
MPQIVVVQLSFFPCVKFTTILNLQADNPYSPTPHREPSRKPIYTTGELEANAALHPSTLALTVSWTDLN